MIPIRFFLASAATLVLASTVCAAAVPVAGFGFRTGVATSRIGGGYYESLGSHARVGFAGAAYCRIPVGRLLSIQPEFGWASKGDEGDLTIRYTSTSGNVITRGAFNTSVKHRIDYLEVPVLLRVGAPNRSFFEPYALVGPGFAYRTGSETEARLTTIENEPGNPGVQRANIFEGVGTLDNPRYRNVDWSMIAGGGLALGRAPFRVVVETRYALGLVGALATADRSTAHNSSWITTLGFELR